MDGESGTDRGPEADSSNIGRRAFVAGTLGGVVASALARLEPAKADDVVESRPLLLSQDNVASQTTGLSQEGSDATLRVENPGDGPGIAVLTNRSSGVQARSTGTGLVGLGGPLPGVRSPVTFTMPLPGAGVIGSGERFGVFAAALPNVGAISIPSTTRVGVPVGVWGSGGALPQEAVITVARDASTPGIGVWGSAPAAPGMGATTYAVAPAGVVGTAFGPEQTAVVAQNPDGTALRVDGGIAVNCGGTGVVPRRETEVEVADSRITPNSVVVVTLAGDPGNRGTTLHHVEVGDGLVRVVLTAPPNSDTPFNYLCFELT